MNQCLDILCRILHCRIEDIVEYIPDEENRDKTMEEAADSVLEENMEAFRELAE